jgi:predicted GNAT family acetyltransferase
MVEKPNPDAIGAVKTKTYRVHHTQVNKMNESFYLQESFTYGKSMVGDKGERIHTKGGHIDVQNKGTEHAPRKQSVIDFHVDEDKRGKGIGKKLIAHALERHKDLGAQASSHGSVKAFHEMGFRHPSMPNGSVEDHVKKMKEDSSVYMAHKDNDGKPYK